MVVDAENIPQHIAIIMDGNGRWAKDRGLPRSAGHRKGVQRVKEILRAAAALGVKAITFFAFSAENWSRPTREINVLMRFLDNFLEREVKELHKNNIKFLVIGRRDPIPKALQKKIREAQELTQNNSGMTAVLALNYGARQEIVDAAKKFAVTVARGEASPEALDERTFSSYLYTAGLPDPDLLIRTSGEMRISNFLLWQLSYTELYFPKKYWPDFTKEDLEAAIEEYRHRERRFGRVGSAD